MNRHDFLVLYFCVANIKLASIYSGVDFCGKNVCGYFYSRELTFADRWKNRKNFVPHGRAKNYVWTVLASRETNVIALKILTASYQWIGKGRIDFELLNCDHCESAGFENIWYDYLLLKFM